MLANLLAAAAAAAGWLRKTPWSRTFFFIFCDAQEKLTFGMVNDFSRPLRALGMDFLGVGRSNHILLHKHARYVGTPHMLTHTHTLSPLPLSLSVHPFIDKKQINEVLIFS
jgi:hypothetical protein